MKRNLLYLILIGFLLAAPLAWSQSSSVSIEPLDSGIRQSITTVTSSTTPIPATVLSGRKSIIVKNLDTANTVYLGGGSVTADEQAQGGYPVIYYEDFQADIGENTVLYGITSGTGTAKVTIIEAR